jgi:hypothetical protein
MGDSSASGAPSGLIIDRLVALENKYDPTKVFRRNQNMRPSVPGQHFRAAPEIRNDFVFAGGRTSSALTRLGKSSQHAVANFEWCEVLMRLIR